MRHVRTAAGLGVTALALAACGGGSGGGGEAVSGGTFVFAVAADPGNLDPQASAASGLFQITHFAYDSLLGLDTDGEVVSQLATDWSVDGTTVTLTMDPDVTCSDGTPFTAEDAAENINYVADPANQSPFLGVFVPNGTTAAGDEDGTVTLTLAAPAPFVLNGLAGVPMVCPAGLADRDALADSTLGTGPFQLTEAVPNDHYTYTVREDYTWGPDGASTSTTGTPDQVVFQIVPNETTAANQLLSGEVNAAQIIGPDYDRLQSAGLFSTSVTAVLGEQWYNQTAGRPAADPAVRLALTQAVDFDQVARVLSADRGGPGTSFAASAPSACGGDSVSGAMPAFDADAAAATLDAAGWVAGPDGTRAKDGAPLAITFLYDTELGASGSAAAELVTAAWQDLGVAVDVTPQDETASISTLFGSGDWDAAWVQLNVSSPDQVVPFVSGPVVPDGNNFAHIANDEYDALVAQASTMEGTDGCDTWLEAEAALVSSADVFPFANQESTYFGSGAEFAVGDGLIPTSIRMQG
ncbi:ABC transporter substrate-binding protein [Klenkia sp. PcliD-1-E]|uniref:ABC transporter substrate-binding protein n=1 Tax=Klenkia sp. PcliD-1-E TaxID=2954492 RepID=UPI002096B8F5|nr:ABC transporter substrate-binding protein [Klenkia sp. PcliD-1-E]MCO7219955.1 ABC transporter substrate-binding protein [Klenkia sp. PcliD-1-E]